MIEIKNLIGSPYPITDILTGKTAFTKTITSAAHLSNVNGIVVFLDGDTENGVVITYAELEEIDGVSSTRRGSP
jgi:hypothetical protein